MRPKTGRARASTKKPSRTYLYWLVRFLRVLGFKLTTVSNALESPFGRFACLTFDGLAAATRSAPVLVDYEAPATVFVNTRGGPSLKNLVPLAKAGWEIGSLGHELVDLTTQGYREQRRLISRSRSLITKQIGKTPLLFAYPYGAYDATSVSCLRDEGFQGAVTLRRGFNNGDLESFHLKRLPLTGSILPDLFMIVRTIVRKAKCASASQSLRHESREAARSG